MINQTTPAGLRLGPIQGPRVQTGLKAEAFDPQPLFRGQEMAINAVIRKDAKIAAQEKERLDFLKVQQELFKTKAGAAGSAELIANSGINVSPFYLKGRNALNAANTYQKEMQQKIYAEIARATSGSGKLDQFTATRNVDLIRREYENKIINDPQILEATKIAKDRELFVKKVEAAGKAGQFVDPVAAQATLDGIDAYMDDPTGELDYNRNSLNINNFTYDEKDMEESLGNLITDSVGESQFAEVVSAATLGAGYNESDGLISESGTVQNERKKALEIMRTRMSKDPRLAAYIQARYRVDANTYLENKIDELLNEDDKRRVVKRLEGVSQVSRNRGQREQDAAAQKRKETATKIDTTYGVEGKTESANRIRAIVKNMVGSDPQYRATSNQIEDALDFIEVLNNNLPEGMTPYSSANIKTDEAGRVVVRDVDDEGGVGQVRKGFGQAPKNPDFAGNNGNRTQQYLSEAVQSMENAVIHENLSAGISEATNALIPSYAERPSGRKNASWYTNNPLNIKAKKDSGLALHSSHDRNKGAKHDGLYHVVYPTLDEGLRAGGQWIIDKFKPNASRWASKEMSLNDFYAGRDNPGGSRYAESGTREHSQIIADVLGVSPDTSMEDIINNKTPEEIALAFTRVEAPEIYRELNSVWDSSPRVGVSVDGEPVSEAPSTKTIATPNSPHIDENGKRVVDQKQLEKSVIAFATSPTALTGKVLDNLGVSEDTKTKLQEIRQIKDELKTALPTEKKALKEKLSQAVTILDDPMLHRAYVTQAVSESVLDKSFVEMTDKTLSNIPDGEFVVIDVERGNPWDAEAKRIRNSVSLSVGKDEGEYFIQYEDDYSKKTKVLTGKSLKEAYTKLRKEIPNIYHSSEVTDYAVNSVISGLNKENEQTPTPSVNKEPTKAQKRADELKAARAKKQAG